MSQTALFITQRALLGKRDDVRRAWEKHVKPHVAANPAHEFYFFCYDDNEPDTIRVYQQYTDRASSEEFMKGSWYRDYLDEVASLLSNPPEIRAATPVWTKGIEQERV
jgi:quinol monooxygenase YgiN